MPGPRTILDTNVLVSGFIRPRGTIAAVAGRVDVLVSGDGDLQSLDPFEGIRILGPAAFLERLSER